MKTTILVQVPIAQARPDGICVVKRKSGISDGPRIDRDNIPFQPLTPEGVKRSCIYVVVFP
jgi:hypothetical protein